MNTVKHLRSTLQIEETIERWIADGGIPVEAIQDTTTLLEAARRHVETEIAKRNRADVRGREHHATSTVRVAIKEQKREKITQILESYAATITMEYTPELLASTFALGDGTRVSWADATEADHLTRIEMLEEKASGIHETAAKHRAAIQSIREKGVKTLAELMSA